MIYFDHNATSLPENEHYQKVLTKLKIVDGNPSSIHSLGRKAKLALEQAREIIASTIGAQANNIILTSGASEANNLVVGYLKKQEEKFGNVPSVFEQLCFNFKSNFGSPHHVVKRM